MKLKLRSLNEPSDKGLEIFGPLIRTGSSEKSTTEEIYYNNRRVLNLTPDDGYRDGDCDSCDNTK